jgi:hypothetical protein
MDTMVGRTLSVHKEHEFLLRLEMAGLSDTLAQKVIDSKDNDLGAKVVHLIMSGGFEPSISQKHARQIMGNNFFGVEEAIKHFGVNPSRQQLAALAEVPWGKKILTSYKDTHVLTAVFPMSILDIRGKIERSLSYGHEDSWYNKETFAKKRGAIGWRLVRKTPVQDSTSKNWNEQQALLSKSEETPSAQVMVYTIIGHYLVTDKRLFENIYVRTSSVDSGGNRVNVGHFDQGGFLIRGCWDGDRYGDLGVSSARQS